jgi:cytochrome b subunit of formate dehydrogenase/ubiquinone/menaquinone biosynthesis C-methylase UbiE
MRINRMSSHIIEDKNLVERHSIIELIEHWAIAVSGLVLFLSGLFQMPLSKRYGISKIPGMEWSADFIFTLKLHYIASAVFVAAALFHIIYHGMLKETGMIPKKGDLKQSIDVIKTFFGKGEEPPFHKYLPEQRLAYVGMALIIAGLIITGLIKVFKNVYMPDMSLAVAGWATALHNIFFILFFLAFLAHMAAIIIKPNRPMVRGIFTGRVRLDYACHRHPLWLAEISKGALKTAVDETCTAPVESETGKIATDSGRDFNAEASTWDDSPHRIEMARSIADAVVSRIQPSSEMEALDYGAGTGLVSLGIQPHLGSITAADSAPAMLEKLDEKIRAGGIENAKTMLLDLENSPAPDLKFDLVISSMVFHHVADISALLSKLCAMLRPGGYIAIADLDPDDGEFHRDPTGVRHNGFDRRYIEDLFAENILTEINSETACTVKREVAGKGEREFTVFLITGKRPETLDKN